MSDDFSFWFTLIAIGFALLVPCIFAKALLGERGNAESDKLRKEIDGLFARCADPVEYARHCGTLMRMHNEFNALHDFPPAYSEDEIRESEERGRKFLQLHESVHDDLENLERDVKRLSQRFRNVEQLSEHFVART